MLDIVPAWVQVAGVATAAGGVMLAMYRAGGAQAIKQNGYVKREDCHTHMDECRDAIRQLGARMQSVGEAVARIEGKMEAHARR